MGQQKMAVILAKLALTHGDPEVRSEARTLYEREHRGLFGDALRRKLRMDAKKT